MQHQHQFPHIVKQVERWDLYARLAPTFFLIICVLLIALDIINFKAAFYIGLGLFAITSVTWWFWTVYTIRHLVHTLNTASAGLLEVRDEFRKINEDIQEFKDDI